MLNFNPDILQTTMMFEAIEFATQAHKGHYRKGTKLPYIIHPLSVAKTLIEHNCPEALIVAAILHDTVEDTPVTLDEIEARFGLPVAHLVEALSEPLKSAAWEERKQHTLNGLKTASLDVLLIMGADKLDNIRSIKEDLAKMGEKIWTKFSRPKEKQAWYYQTLAKILVKRIDGEPSASLFRQLEVEVETLFGPIPPGPANNTRALAQS